MQRVEVLGQTSASSLLVMRGLAAREPPKMSDHHLPLGHAVHANLANDAWRQDLLCSAGAHAEECLKLRAVYPGVRQFAQSRDDLVEFAAPGGPIRHFPLKKHTTDRRDFA